MTSEQQLRDVRMACLFGDEFRQTEPASRGGGNATILDILRPGLEAQRAQVIANLNGGSQQTEAQKIMQSKGERASDSSVDEIASIYDFIDKEYECIQQYSGVSTCAESTQDLFRDRSSSGTRSAYTDTYSSTSYAGTGSMFSGSADSAIGMDKSNGSKSGSKSREKVPECRPDMMIWKDLDIGEGMGVVCMPNGNVAVSDFETHDIIVYNDLGIRVSSSQEGGLKLSCPRGLAYHPQESGLVVAEWTKGRLLVLSSDARKRLRRINVSMRPFGVAVLSTGDIVVVGMFKLHGTWSGGAAVIDLKGKEKRRWRGGLDKPWHVVVGPRDLIYVSDFRSHCILVFTPEGRKVRCLKGASDELTFPKGLCLLNDIILVCHDVTSVSGGKASHLTAWTRHGRHLGLVLNWPVHGGCRLRGIAVHNGLLVAVGNYKVLTYKLTYRDVIRRSVTSQPQGSTTEVDIVYDDNDAIYRNRQQHQFMQNRIALLNHQNQINASKVQRVIPFVRSPCDTISENEDKNGMQILPLEKLPPSEPGDMRGPLFPDTPQPFPPPANMKPMQDNPNVIYQRGIKYFRGYTSGRKTTYNPIYSPADNQHITNPTPELSDNQEDQSAYIDFDANTPDARKSYKSFSQGSFYSSQPNLNSPDPWVYQSQSSLATRSEPYSPCYYDMKPCSPNYIDLRSIRQTALPRSPFDVSESQLHLQNLDANKSFGVPPPYQVAPTSVPAYLNRHLSPSDFLPPATEVVDQHPIDLITELYDYILKLDDDDTDGDDGSHENNDEEANEQAYGQIVPQINQQMQEDVRNLNSNFDRVINTEKLADHINAKTHRHEAGEQNKNLKIDDLKNVEAKPFIPEPPPLIETVLHPSLRKKHEKAVLSSFPSNSSDANSQGNPKPSPPPVAKKPQIDKAELRRRLSIRVSQDERVSVISQETSMAKSNATESQGRYNDQMTQICAEISHQETSWSKHSGDNSLNVEAATLPAHRSGCGDWRYNSGPTEMNDNVSYNTGQFNQPQQIHKEPKQQKLEDKSDNLETTRRLLSYTPSSPAQALAKILKASVAKPAWEIDTTDDERVNSVLDSICDLSEEEADAHEKKPNMVKDSHDFIVDRVAIQVQLAQAIESIRHRDTTSDIVSAAVVHHPHDGDTSVNSCEPGSYATDSKSPNINQEEDQKPEIEDRSLLNQLDIKEVDKRVISPGNTIQRGKPNTYIEKPVVHRTRTISPVRVDSFQTAFIENPHQNLEIPREHLISPDFPPPPSPASLEQLPDTDRLVMSPVPTKPMTLQSPQTTMPLTSEKGIINKVADLRNVTSPPPYLPPPPPIARDDRLLQTPDLPPPPMPVTSEMFVAKAHVACLIAKGVSQKHVQASNQTGHFDQGIPIARVVNKPLKDFSSISALTTLQKPPKNKQPKRCEPPTKHKHFSAFHNIIRRAFHHKTGSQDKMKDARGNGMNHLKDSSTLKSTFRHSFCNSRITNQPEEEINQKSSCNRTNEEVKDQEENGSRKKRFERRNTICGVSALKANQADTETPKATGRPDPHSEV